MLSPGEALVEIGQFGTVRVPDAIVVVVPSHGGRMLVETPAGTPVEAPFFEIG